MSSSTATQNAWRSEAELTSALGTALVNFVLLGNAAAQREWSPRIVKDLFELKDDELIACLNYCVIATHTIPEGDEQLVLWDSENDRAADGRTRDDLTQTGVLEVSTVRIIDQSLASSAALMQVWSAIPELNELGYLERLLVKFGIDLIEFELQLNKANLVAYRKPIATTIVVSYLAASLGSLALDAYNSIALKDKAYAVLSSVFLPQAAILFRQMGFNRAANEWRMFTSFWESYLCKLGTQIATVMVTTEPEFSKTFEYAAVCFSTRSILSNLRIFGSFAARNVERIVLKKIGSTRPSEELEQWLARKEAAAQWHMENAKLVAFLMNECPPGRALRNTMNFGQGRAVELSRTLMFGGANPPEQPENHDRAEKMENLALAGLVAALAIATALRSPYARVAALASGSDMVSSAFLDMIMAGVRADHAHERTSQRLNYFLTIQLPVNLVTFIAGPEYLSNPAVYLPMAAAGNALMFTYGERISKPVSDALTATRVPKLIGQGISGSWRLTAKMARLIVKILKTSSSQSEIPSEFGVIEMGLGRMSIDENRRSALPHFDAALIEAQRPDEPTMTPAEFKTQLWLSLSSEDAQHLIHSQWDEEDLHF